MVFRAPEHTLESAPIITTLKISLQHPSISTGKACQNQYAGNYHFINHFRTAANCMNLVNMTKLCDIITISICLSHFSLLKQTRNKQTKTKTCSDLRVFFLKSAFLKVGLLLCRPDRPSNKNHILKNLKNIDLTFW